MPEIWDKAFAKRTGAGAIAKAKGKPKELSPVDAALAIQGSYRAHLIRRSLALRSLRELAVAKAKLKEIRFLFNNFAYRRRLAHDTQERKCFSERIIALLLTVDAIQVFAGLLNLACTFVHQHSDYERRS